MKALEYSDLVNLQLAKDALDVEDAKLDTIGEEIEKLKRQEEDLSEELGIDYGRFQRKLLEYGSPNLREFMVLLEEKLPRELRDMVYEHLSISGHRIHLNPSPGARTPTDTWIRHIHQTLFDSYFVTKCCAYEIPEFYWANNSFEFDVSLEDTTHFHHALGAYVYDKYPYHEVLGSPYQKIRHLRVNLRCEKWDKCHRCHGILVPAPSFCTFSSGITMRDLERIVEGFHHFSGQQRTHVEFVIHTTLPKLWTSWEAVKFPGERHWLNILESIRYIVFKLKFSGVRVTVIISNTPPKFLSWREKCALFPEDEEWSEEWDLTPHLLLSAEDWAKENAGSGWANDRYLSKEGFAADPEGAYTQLERRWGMRRPLPWWTSLGLEDDSPDEW